MLASTSTVTQGTKGLGLAISDFVMREWVVCLPLNDNQDYDLVVDQGDGPQRVQIKTTRYKSGGSYVVQLKRVRHNRTRNTLHKFDNTKIDFLYVLCDDGRRYMIPAREIAALNSLSLSSKWTKYEIGR